MKKFDGVITAVMSLVMVSTGFLMGGESEKSVAKSTTFSKTAGIPVATMLNINRVAAWYSADGEQERIPGSGNSGLYFPRGTGTAVYSAGLVWGGRFNDGRAQIVRVNGQSYNNGTKPGAILGIRTGVTEDPNASDVRIWRIRRDWATADLRQDAAEVNEIALSNVSDAQIQAVRDQYKQDWLEWPAQKGAPYYDRNGTPGYQPHPDAIYSPTDSTYDEPGIGGADQVAWYVCNDIGVPGVWASLPSGMEEQATIWGYNRTDPLGNVIFKRFRLIYKGLALTPANARIDSMYMCQWSDIDLGDAGDDYSSCDTALSLGFTYNAVRSDAVYEDFSLPPPASGYDFLQGPLVPGVAGQDLNKNGVDDASDFGIFDLKRVGPGYINLPMTSFIYFAAGGFYSDPPFNYNGTIQWYQMLRGLPPTPQGPPDPPRFINPVTGLPTTYWLSGDPVTRTGWTDGIIESSGDRRILLNTGPFTMALGDTQELVSAWVGGIGKDYIGSIRVMKFNDKSVQLAYNSLFSLPKPPPAPNVRVSVLDGEVILDWEWDSASVARTEIPVEPPGYRFEGYNIYQLPSSGADISTGKRLVTFDVPNGTATILQETFDENSGEVVRLPVQFGTDNGIKRYLSITNDELRSRPLVNGQRYYFAVTAYSFLPDTVDPNNPLRALESSSLVFVTVPEKPKPGTLFAYSVNDTVLGIKDVVGGNDAPIYPVIFNRSRQNGEDLNQNNVLEITEDQNSNGVLDPGEDRNGNGRLDTYDEDFNKNGRLDPFVYEVRFDSASPTSFMWTLTNKTTGRDIYRNITDVSGVTEYRVPEEGFALYVGLPQKGMKSVTDTAGNNLFGPSSTSSTLAILGRSGNVGDVAGFGNTNKIYEIRFDGTGSFALRLPGFGSPIGAYRVPFSVWDLGRAATDTPKQVIAAIQDSGNTPSTWNLTPNPFLQGGKSYRIFEPVYITSIPYPTSNDSATIEAQRLAIRRVAVNRTEAQNAIYDCLIADLTGSATLPPVGTKIRFNKYLEIRKGDVKSFTPLLATIGNVNLAKTEVQNVRVFPNPYYGINRAETDRVNRFVTFSHLPDRAVIRIYSLAGILVRTLLKDDPPSSNQFFRWNLQNEQGLPVASGMYIAYIELKDANGNDLGTKTLKIAIIQEQQFLRFY